MATEHVKVYEDGKRGGVPVWAWLLPLLLLLALLLWWLFGHRGNTDKTAAPASAPTVTATNVSAMPTLGAVHFDTDDATLTSDDQTNLTQAADYMKRHPETRLRLEGYTDSTGNTPHNLSLSERRAQAVEQFFTAHGVDRSRLTGEGFGPANPAATNATEPGKADNRRVELFTQAGQQ